jgi:hypothetical protein
LHARVQMQTGRIALKIAGADRVHLRKIVPVQTKRIPGNSVGADRVNCAQ